MHLIALPEPPFLGYRNPIQARMELMVFWIKKLKNAHKPHYLIPSLKKRGLKDFCPGSRAGLTLKDFRDLDNDK
jgi:hypothetical protein